MQCLFSNFQGILWTRNFEASVFNFVDVIKYRDLVCEFSLRHCTMPSIVIIFQDVIIKLMSLLNPDMEECKRTFAHAIESKDQHANVWALRRVPSWKFHHGLYLSEKINKTCLFKKKNYIFTTSFLNFHYQFLFTWPCSVKFIMQAKRSV